MTRKQTLLALLAALEAAEGMVTGKSEGRMLDLQEEIERILGDAMFASLEDLRAAQIDAVIELGVYLSSD